MLDTYGIMEWLRLITSASRLTTFKPCYTMQTPALLARDESQQPSRRNRAGFVLSSEGNMTAANTVCERCCKAYYTSPCKLARSRYCSKACQYDFEALFWSHVEKTDGCWLWKSIIDERGYGVFVRTINGKAKRMRAHRVAYDLTHDEPLGKLLGCHSCDNPPCVRPDHIWPGTDLDNALDSIAKGRNGAISHPECQIRGAAAFKAKLTDEIVMQIRNEYANTPISTRVLAERYGVSRPSIRCIINGKSWSHLPVVATSIREKDRHAVAMLSGDSHPNTVLPVATMREISAIYAAGGVTRKELALRFGVKVGVIGNATTKY